MLSAIESSTIGLFMRVLAVLREQQPQFERHPAMMAVIGEMRSLMVAVLDLLDEDELEELLTRYAPEMALLYPTAPFLILR